MRLVFAGPIKGERVDKFRQYFKDEDPTFKTAGNEEEICALAGWVLAENCTTDLCSAATVAILTSAACGARKPSLSMDLVGIAAHEIKINGDRIRERYAIEIPEVYDITSLDKLLEPMVQAPTTAADTIKTVLSTVILHLENERNGLVEAIKNNLEVQNEELQMLWWLLGEWSEQWEVSFVNMDIKARPILLAHELATLCPLPTEPRSIKSILSRVKINGSAVTIPEAVSACRADRLPRLRVDVNPCPILTPVHFAIVRACETGGDSSWIVPWEKISKISGEFSFSALDLAVQYFRERKLLLQLNPE